MSCAPHLPHATHVCALLMAAHVGEGHSSHMGWAIHFHGPSLLAARKVELPTVSIILIDRSVSVNSVVLVLVGCHDNEVLLCVN